MSIQRLSPSRSAHDSTTTIAAQDCESVVLKAAHYWAKCEYSLSSDKPVMTLRGYLAAISGQRGTRTYPLCCMFNNNNLCFYPHVVPTPLRRSSRIQLLLIECTNVITRFGRHELVPCIRIKLLIWLSNNAFMPYSNRWCVYNAYCIRTLSSKRVLSTSLYSNKKIER